MRSCTSTVAGARGWIEPWAIKCPSQWVGPPPPLALLTWCMPSLERGIAQASWRPEHLSRGKRETGESARQKSFDHHVSDQILRHAKLHEGCVHGSRRPRSSSAMEQCRYTCCSCINLIWCVATVLAQVRVGSHHSVTDERTIRCLKTALWHTLARSPVGEGQSRVARHANGQIVRHPCVQCCAWYWPDYVASTPHSRIRLHCDNFGWPLRSPTFRTC
jgi:hypothetical protein